MKPNFAIVYAATLLREVKLYASVFEDAFQTARYLSTISDIRYSSLYGMHNEKEMVLLCQFQHGIVHRLLPEGEQLMKLSAARGSVSATTPYELSSFARYPEQCERSACYADCFKVCSLAP